MIQDLSFYLFLFLLFAAIGWFLYHSLCDEAGQFLGEYAQWLVRQSEVCFETLTLKQARTRIAAWTLGPALALAVVLGHPLFGLVGAVVGWHVPRWMANSQVTKRRKAFDAQLVDALVLLSNSLRSGLSLLQGFRILVKELPPPISQEFELVLREQQISAMLDDALVNLGERIKSKDLDIVITSILTLRETGGNLPETFDTVTYTIRERKKVEGKIDSLTTLGMTQGIFACVLPYAFLGLMSLVQPQIVKPLLTTWIGWGCIGLATVLDIIGYFAIRKVVTIKV